MKKELIAYIRKAFALVPEIGPDLKGKARFLFQSLRPTEYKTYEFYLATLERLIRSVYEGNLGGEFVDIMANLISGQLTQAYEQAWTDEGNDLPVPQYLTDAAEIAILNQYDHVDQFFRDIVDARLDETPIDPLLARAPLWANRWEEAYNDAIHQMTLQNGGKEEWVLGATEVHCTTCKELAGIVAYASEWDALDVHPQNGPNEALECGGWHCDCSRVVTDAKRTRGAYEKIQSIISKG